MTKFYFGEIIITILLIGLLLSLLLPTGLLMPMSLDVMLILAVIITFLIFSTFFWKERAVDERDNIHRMNAGRISFFIGAGILVIGIVQQSFRHDIDPWLVYALVGMIVAKLLARMYSDIRQ